VFEDIVPLFVLMFCLLIYCRLAVVKECCVLLLVQAVVLSLFTFSFLVAIS
jgi:hypothetical protein